MSEKKANREDTKTRRSPEAPRRRAGVGVMTPAEVELMRHVHMACEAVSARDRGAMRLARTYAGHSRRWIKRWWDITVEECAP